MAVPVVITKVLASADDDGICASQTPMGAGNLVLNGAKVTSGVAHLDTQRQVVFTFAGDETGHTFVVYGTQENGGLIQESVAGTVTGTAVTLLNFLTVTRISNSAAAADAIKVGTNGVGATPWVNANWHLTPANLSIACVVGGTVTYTVQYTYDDFYTPPPFGVPSSIPTAFPDATVASKSANFVATMNDPIRGWRIQVGSGTAPVTATGIQAGIAN